MLQRPLLYVITSISTLSLMYSPQVVYRLAPWKACTLSAVTWMTCYWPGVDLTYAFGVQ